MPPGHTTEEGGLNGDELREDLSLAGQSSPASKTSPTTANFQAMQAMFNDNQARLSVSVRQLDNSIVVPPAGDSVVEGSESTAPTIEFPAPPNTTTFSAAPTLTSQQATPAARPSYDSYLLATALSSLSIYEPPYPNSSDNFLLVAGCAHYPKAFIQAADLNSLIFQMDVIRPKVRKLYDSVTAGLKALVEIQREAEKLQEVEFREGEEERWEDVRRWEDVVGKIDGLLMDVEGVVGYTCPDNYGEVEAGGLREVIG